MSSQKDHKFMKNADKCYNIVLQSSAKGINADEIAEKLDVHRTTVYNYLNTLEYMGKVESHQGIWRAKTGEQMIKPLEKEIVIELPIPKNQWRQIGTMEAGAKYLEDLKLPRTAEEVRILLEKFNETRIIRIKGKNVDNLDLQKLANLIQEANEKTSKFRLKRLIKTLKRSHPTQNG